MSIPCTIKQLPIHQQIEAANTAIELNPTNRPSTSRLLNLLKLVSPQEEPIILPQHLAVMTGKRWPATGVKLSVQFLDNPSQKTRAKIIAMANAWGAFCNVRFLETLQTGQVRVTRTPGQGYYSYLGTDILHIPAGQNTMNLESFTDSTSDAEYIRVAKHEFGHTLGFPHEHLRPDVVSLLDPEKTIAEFMRTQGWTRQEVINQVLAPLPPGSFTGSASADIHSIMCYFLPASITKNNLAIPGGNDIDEVDKVTAAKFYPLEIPPPPPPPPPPALTPTIILSDTLGPGKYNITKV